VAASLRALARSARALALGTTGVCPDPTRFSRGASYPLQRPEGVAAEIFGERSMIRTLRFGAGLQPNLGRELKMEASR
jgi:hypothetical protein